YRIPLLMLISYRGEFGERDPWQTQGGKATEPVLRALGIPYDFLREPGEVARKIASAQTLAHAAEQPVALLLCRHLMWDECWPSRACCGSARARRSTTRSRTRWS